MIVSTLSGTTQYSKIVVECEACRKQRVVLRIVATRSLSKTGENLCMRCAALKNLKLKPQCSPFYWTAERKTKHGVSVKTSAAYRAAIPQRAESVRGPKNGMFGRKHSAQTLARMSASRTGKFGEKATAWKGGKTSLLKRLGKLIKARTNWFARVLRKDRFKCVVCGATGKLDAHHVFPLCILVKELCWDKNDWTLERKLEWLILQPEIRDPFLQNGVTLCGDCHQKAHGKGWKKRIYERMQSWIQAKNL